MKMQNLLLAATLLPGSTSVWTDGQYTWGGNPACAEEGFLLSSQSPAIDAGALTELHCPAAGLNPSGCIEWFGVAPDVGACEYWIVSGLPDPPRSLTVQ